MELIRYRGDHEQALLLENRLNIILHAYADSILDLDAEIAQVWGRLRVLYPENTLNKQIAATTLIHDLTLITRNTKDFCSCCVRLLNPFTESISW